MLSSITSKVGKRGIARPVNHRLRPFHVSAGFRYIKTYDKQFDIIGIDLGTSKSCVAIMEGKNARVIENAEGARTTPSIVAFTKDGQRLVGSAAKRQAVANPTHTLTGVKRLIGRYFQDSVIQDIRKIVPYKLVQARDGNDECWVEAQGRKFSPAEISSLVLGKLKETAESALGRPVRSAVITVPAFFDDDNRLTIKRASELAGLEVESIINESSATALVYGMQHEAEVRTFALFDLGGGTFDITILEVGSGVFTLRGAHGDTLLGGDDFDDVLVRYLLAEFKNETSIDLSSDPGAMQRLREASESAKIELDGSFATDVSVPFITTDITGPKHLNVNLSRTKYESLVEHLVERTLVSCRACLERSGLKKDEINDIILVGGMARMPKIQESVEALFGRKPTLSSNPVEVVAMGAAAMGGILQFGVKDSLLSSAAERMNRLNANADEKQEG